MAVRESSSMTEAPIKPAIAFQDEVTTRNEIVDFAILPEDFLDGYTSSDEKAQDEAKKPGRVGRLSLVEVHQVG